MNLCSEFDQILDLGGLPDSRSGEGPQHQPIKAFEPAGQTFQNLNECTPSLTDCSVKTKRAEVIINRSGGQTQSIILKPPFNSSVICRGHVFHRFGGENC